MTLIYFLTPSRVKNFDHPKLHSLRFDISTLNGCLRFNFTDITFIDISNDLTSSALRIFKITRCPTGSTKGSSPLYSQMERTHIQNHLLQNYN